VNPPKIIEHVVCFWKFWKKLYCFCKKGGRSPKKFRKILRFFEKHIVSQKKGKILPKICEEYCQSVRFLEMFHIIRVKNVKTKTTYFIFHVFTKVDMHFVSKTDFSKMISKSP